MLMMPGTRVLPAPNRREQAASTTLPAGALGVYFGKDYNSTYKAIPNALSSEPLSAAINRAPTRMFKVPSASPVYYAGNQITWTNDYADGPDGSPYGATRLVGTTSNWYVAVATVAGTALPAGTYTVSVWAKSNGGGLDTFAFSADNTATRSSVKTATGTWTQFSYTFTRGSAGSHLNILLCGATSSTAVDIQIAHFRLDHGSTALVDPALGGHLYLGGSIYDTAIAVGPGYFDLSSGLYGCIQFPTETAHTEYTAIAIAAKTASGTSLHAFMSRAQNYLNHTSYFELSNRAENLFGSGNAKTQSGGLWSFHNRGWYTYTLRQTSTQNDVFIGETPVIRNVDSNATSVSTRDLLVGIVNGTALPAKHRVAAMAIWPRALSDAEAAQARAYLLERCSPYYIVPPPERVLVAEGDSITYLATSYVYTYGPNSNPFVVGANYAVSGSTIANLVTRAAGPAGVDSIIPTTGTGGRKYILSVLIGANDLISYASAADFLAALSAYTVARRAAGWKVVVCTVLPKDGDATFNSRRATVNAAFTSSWVSSGYADAIVDWSGTTMGPDTARTDVPANWTDAIHPTTLGHTVLEPVYRAVINAL